MFCDLVGSTALSAALDPEDMRELIRSYHLTCAQAIRGPCGLNRLPDGRVSAPL